MSFKHIQDVQAGKTSKVYKLASGTSFGHSPVDQPDQYAYVTDFDCWQRRLQVRGGSRKDEQLGFLGDIEAIFPINVFPESMVGMVVNGNLTLYLSDDIVAGKQNFYSWDDVRKKFTWDSLKNKTWRDLVTGRGK